MKQFVIGLLSFLCLGMFFYVSAQTTAARKPSIEKIELKSSAFRNNAAIPKKYTCDGENLSPPLSWEGSVPEGTESFVIICYDSHPIANNWVHWVIYNIPLGTVRLEEGVGGSGGVGDVTLPGGITQVFQGLTTFMSIGYGGPCPPPGTGLHKYHFMIYALDIPRLTFPKDPKLVDRDDVDEAMKGHILGKGMVTGTYSK